MDWTNPTGLNEAEIHSVRDYLDDADKLTRFLASYYKSTIPPPELIVAHICEPVARANKYDQIELSTGFVTWLQALINTWVETGITYEPFNDGRKLTLSSKLLRLAAFRWVIAHEFFHVTRGHVRYLEERRSQSKESGPDIRHPLEIDADGLAIAGLYRHLMCCAPPGLPPVIGKIIVLIGVFFPVRELIGTVSSDQQTRTKHPSWHFRLAKVHERLANLDNVPIGNPERARKEGQILYECLMVAENSYAHKKGIAAQSGPLVSYLESEAIQKDFKHARKCWDLIAPDILRLGYLPSLRY